LDPIFTTLIEADVLFRLSQTKSVKLVDCRFDLDHPGAGFESYKRGHISGSVYAHLENDLSDLDIKGAGRHPLPSPERLRKVFTQLGIGSADQVVAYDQNHGAFAARLWWLLRYMGHRKVAVLNGGMDEWCRHRFPTVSGVDSVRSDPFQGAPKFSAVVSREAVMEAPLIVDSRDPIRFRGEEELRDPRAGHIPGAINYYFFENLDENKRFLSKSELKERFQQVLGQSSPSSVVFYCGSGVTACHNLLAMVHAGLTCGKLFPGSWSEWSSQSELPVAIGA
jgi:thiosulfate/3-mercaptopyruvate sulfurtransferase